MARDLKEQIQQGINAMWRAISVGHVLPASNIARDILKYQPYNPDALHGLGVLALQDGDIEAAIILFNKALRKEKNNPQLYSNLGLALHEQGKLDFAKEQYLQAIRIDNDYVDAYYNLHALQLVSGGTEEAIKSLLQVLKLQPGDRDASTMLAMLYDFSGQSLPVTAYAEQLHTSGDVLFKSRWESWQYLKSKKNDTTRITGSNWQTFQLAMAAANVEGFVMEFGVRHGNTIRQIAGLAKQQVHGFDSFEGLPEDWHQEAKGSYSTQGKRPTVPKNVALHAGWFSDSLPAFLEGNPGPLRLANIDCDLYSSTVTVLEHLAPRIVAGSVLVFDEYIGNLHWREDEFKAFQEAVSRYAWQYEYLAFSMFTKQVAVRITGLG